MSTAWLANLEAGSKVAIKRGFGGEHSICTVDRVTATQVVVNGIRYNRTNGYQIGSHSSYLRPRIEEATPQRIEAAQRAWLIDQIKNAKFEHVSTDALKSAWQSLRPAP